MDTAATWFATCHPATAVTCRIPRALCQRQMLQALGSFNIWGTAPSPRATKRSGTAQLKFLY